MSGRVMAMGAEHLKSVFAHQPLASLSPSSAPSPIHSPATMNGPPVATHHHDTGSRLASVADRSATPSGRSETHDASPMTESSSSSPLTTMPDMTAEILRVACMRGDLSDLPQRILLAATTATNTTTTPNTSTATSTSDEAAPGPAILRLLFACLRTLGVDFSAALASVESQQMHRCTRCAASFRAADNTPTACAVPHSTPLVSWDIELVADGVEPCETLYYTCCGRCVVVFPDQGEEDVARSVGHMCYVGPHVAEAAPPVPDEKLKDRSASESVPWHGLKVHAGDHERPETTVGAGFGHGTGKMHQALRPPAVQAWYGPGTSVRRPPMSMASGSGSFEGRSVPTSSPTLRLSRTAAWVNSTVAAQAGPDAWRCADLDGRRDVAAKGSLGGIGCSTTKMTRNLYSSVASTNTKRSTNIAAPVPIPPRNIQTTPWLQSSGYYLPSWLAVVPGPRRPFAGEAPFA